MSIFCLVGGEAETPYPEDKLVKEMRQDRYFKPGIIHGGEDYLIRVYLNDSHAECEDNSDHNQFEVEYISADLILEAAENDTTLGNGFDQQLYEQLESFGVTSVTRDFYALCQDWDKAVPMTNEELVRWAKSVTAQQDYTVRVTETLVFDFDISATSPENAKEYFTSHRSEFDFSDGCLTDTEVNCVGHDQSITKSRLETLLIAAIEHAVDCSEQQTHDVLRAIGITSDELESIGYDKANYPAMHAWVSSEDPVI